MDIELFDYSPIVGRPPVRWPGDARVAFYAGLNIEHFHVDRPSASFNEATAKLVPDPVNYGWRDYGARVGIWRLIDVLDRQGIRASALLNSEAGERYPQIVAAGRERGWAWLAHGKSNSIPQAGLAENEERALLAEVFDSIEKTTGQRPRGWLAPGLTETFATPRLLAELGAGYVLDWTNDDQPYPLNVPGLLSVPYTLELSDMQLFHLKSHTGADYVQIVKDQFDQLYADSAAGGRVMALSLHPFVAGQPFRLKYVEAALEYIVGHPGVWVTTSDEIAAHALSPGR
ncbi:polysaccharide deacetylase family protein [Amycolatopsis sp., V23-08]|uniref:Polysaccharide deacetylase family protein n=1 Tax=Amycolatopsis heterodermiae TaxID=3110235 RepID=A0ABU5RM15_9PSEU|nr:polysaccharide deacetylase family protein [Amycolatopsis sp., V23-08]MEA5367337.1 polysaccharide deacetylase family protein [Amycolatopsis sp., V23-08]